MHRQPPTLAAKLLTIVCVVAAILVVAIWAGPLFSGALFLLWPTVGRPVAHDLPSSYEPLHQGHVDVSTGLYIREDEDFVLTETPGFIWRRTYLSGDHVLRQFGIGATHNAEWYLIGDPAQFRWAELILEDGGRIHFDRLTPGSSYQNAVFGHNGTPTSFYGAMLGWVGFAWALRVRDGSVLTFQACDADSTSVCSLVQIRDSDGHRVSFNRNSSGRVQRVDTGRQYLAFEYDERQRVVKVSDNQQRVVSYAYDAAGRLIRATSGKVVRSYEYDAEDHLTTVDEPGRRIENRYDNGGRLIHQTVHRVDRPDYVEAFAYTVQGDDVIGTDVTEDNETRTRYRFNPRRYVISESYEASGRAPVTVLFDRGSGEFVQTLTVKCMKYGRPVTETLTVRSGDVEGTKAQLIEDNCK